MNYIKKVLHKRLDRAAYRLNFSLIAFIIVWSDLLSVQQFEGALMFFIIATVCLLVFGTMRCHDIGVSGWKQFIPGFHFYLLVAEGDENTNQYGPVSDIPLSWIEDERNRNKF